jgi:hypothetical protein
MMIVVLLVILILFFLNKSSFQGETTLYQSFEKKFSYHRGPRGDLVDAIYCIVMPDRKNYMKRVLSQLGYNYHLLDAVTPADINQSTYKTLAGTDFFRYTKKTRLPLQLSFTMCYLNAIKKGYSTIIVFEDDITVNVNNRVLEDSIKEFKNSKYSMFYMGYCYLNCNQPFQKGESSLINVPDYSKLWCAHSICYKVKYLEDLIDYLYPMTEEFDVQLVNFIKRYSYRVCIPKEVYFSQDKGFGTNNETLNSDGTFTPDPLPCSI